MTRTDRRMVDALALKVGGCNRNPKCRSRALCEPLVMAPDLLISGDSVSTEMDGVPATIVAMTEDARQLTEVDYDLIEFARRIVDSNSDGLVHTARSVIAHPPASPNRQIGAPHRIGDRHGACSRPRSRTGGC